MACKIFLCGWKNSLTRPDHSLISAIILKKIMDFLRDARETNKRLPVHCGEYGSGSLVGEVWREV